MEYVYHSSKQQGLTAIEPRHSTHGKAWVYAMRSPILCAMFLGNNNDLIVQTSVSEGLPILAERFAGALDVAYKNKTGSIYLLDATSFIEDQTTFEPELISEHLCEVLGEERIYDALEHIIELEINNKIKIFRYPDLPVWMPTDKSDLIEKVVAWGRKPGSTILEAIADHHPDILDEVRRQLSEPDPGASVSSL